MIFAGDFSPCAPGEAEPFSIDFANRLEPGDSILSVTSSLTVHTGIDPGVSSRLSGSPACFGTVATQTLAGLVAGVAYNLTFSAQTSFDRSLVNYGRVACVAIS